MSCKYKKNAAIVHHRCILPLAWLFARIWGLHAVWYSFAIAEIISVTMSTLLFLRIYREKIAPLGDAGESARPEAAR